MRRPALVLALLVAGGCATHSIEKVAAPARPARAVSLEQAISAYDTYCRGLTTLNGTGDLDVKDFRAGKERKLGVRVLAERGGRLYVKGSVLLVTGLEVVANGERFWFQVPSRKTVWTGRADAQPTAEGSQNEPYYALRPRDVNAALLPEPLEGERTIALESDATHACLVVLGPGEGGANRALVRRRACLDRETLTPAGLAEYDEHGELTAEVAFGDVRDGFAHRVAITRSRQGYLAAFNFEKAVVNGPVPEKAFEPRSVPDYKVVEVTP